MLETQSIFYLKQQGRYQEALDLVLRLLAQGLDTPELAVDHADVLARLGRPAEALEVLESARLHHRLSPYGRALLGGLLQNARRPEEAREQFEELTEEASVPLAVARRVADFLADERVPRLLERWSRDTPEWYRLRGRFDPPALKQGLERFPDSQELFEDYVVARLKGESPEAMADELETLLSLKDHAQSTRLRERLAQSLRELKEPARALEQLLECVRRQPDNGYYLANVGYVCSELGRLAEAMDFLERAIARRKNDRYAVNAYVKTCREAGDSLRAADFLAQKLEASPEDRPLLNGFLTACKDSGQGDRARAYIAGRAKTQPALWGAYRRVFK